jgi:hypothetical protein
MNIPWEDRAELGTLRAFKDTLILSIRAPTRFYTLVPKDGSPWPPLVYGVVFTMAVAVPTFLWSITIGEQNLASALAPYKVDLEELMPGALDMLGKATAGSAVFTLVTAPLSFFLNLHVLAATTWIGLRLANCLHTSYGRIWRLFAYASWVQIFDLLSITGNMALGTISFLVVLGLGAYYWVTVVTASQGIDAKRAVVSSVYGALVAAAFGCVLLLPPLIVAVLVFVLKVPGILPK